MPVRVQWMRQDEHAWAPQQPGRTHDLRGAVDASGRIVAWQEESWGIRARWDQGWPLPWILLGTAKPVDAGSSGATGTPSYVIANQRNVSHSVDPLTRPMYMRTVAGTQQTFIQESFMDELAAAAGADPIEFRIKHLDPASATTPRAMTRAPRGAAAFWLADAAVTGERRERQRRPRARVRPLAEPRRAALRTWRRSRSTARPGACG